MDSSKQHLGAHAAAVVALCAQRGRPQEPGRRPMMLTAPCPSPARPPPMQVADNNGAAAAKPPDTVARKATLPAVALATM